MTELMNHIVHVRYNGCSTEVPLSQLGLQADVQNEQILQAVARHLDLPAHVLNNHVVVRTGQAIIVRPEAVYG